MPALFLQLVCKYIVRIARDSSRQTFLRFDFFKNYAFSYFSISGRSPYMVPRKPGEYVYPEAGGSSSSVSKAIVTILAVLASLVTVALCLLLALLLLKKYSKNIPGSPGGSDQVDGEIPQDMRKSFTHFCK